MGKTCRSWKNVYSPQTGGMVRRCRSWSTGGLGSLGDLPGLGQATTLTGTMKSVQGVLMTGAIAAGGAILTDRVFSMVADKLNLSGYTQYLAEAATGVALGIVIGKVTKKPKLGAAVAIGPVVLAALKILAETMKLGPFAGVSYPMGLTTIDPYRPELQGANLGRMQVGAGVPPWMVQPQDVTAGAFAAY